MLCCPIFTAHTNLVLTMLTEQTCNARPRVAGVRLYPAQLEAYVCATILANDFNAPVLQVKLAVAGRA